MPVSSLEFPLDVHVVAEPVVSTEYKVKLQSLEVKVTSSDRRLKVADQVGGVFDAIATELTAKLKEFSYDVKAHARGGVRAHLEAHRSAHR